jgi:hypothetical protein
LEHWSKGVPVRAEEFREVKTVEQARNVLSESKIYDEHKLQASLDAIDKLKDRHSDAVGRATKSLESVANVLRDRRQKVQNLAQDISEQYRNGDLGKGTRLLGRIERNLESGMNASFVQEASLTDDLTKFMASHGFEDLLPGYDGPILRSPEPAPEVVDPTPAVVDMALLENSVNTALANLDNNEMCMIVGDLNPNMIALVNDDNTAKMVIAPEDIEEGMHIQIECTIVSMEYDGDGCLVPIANSSETIVLDIEHFNVEDLHIDSICEIGEAPEYVTDFEMSEIDFNRE